MSLVGVIKINNGVKESEGVYGGKYTYSRLNMKQVERPVVEEVVAETSTTINEVVTTEYLTEEEQKQALYDEIMRNVEIKKAARRKEEEKKERQANAERWLKERMREEKNKWTPKTKAQALMDAVGIDRYAVVQTINELERNYRKISR